jgi:hypothetical protein
MGEKQGVRKPATKFANLRKKMEKNRLQSGRAKKGKQPPRHGGR